jgi:hypothetical protein
MSLKTRTNPDLSRGRRNVAHLVDDADLEGLSPTIGFLSMKDHGIEAITELLIKKLRS